MAQRFDDLFMVSDLHLGGGPDAAVFDSPRQLAAFVRWAADRAQKRSVALVIGGDIVDFLAFQGATYFNPANAVAWLRSLDKEGAPTRIIFEALRTFTSSEKAHLVLVVGNHDVELAFPEAARALLSMVASTNARGRVTTCFDGTSFTCSIGGRSVLCLHGNERDDWNVIDHGAVRRWICEANAGRRPPPPEPNAGTRLVVEVINRIKGTLPCIDLLKPEGDAVPNVLLSLDSERRNLGIGDVVRSALAIVRRKLEDRRRLRRGLLGSTDPVDMAAFRDHFENDVPPNVGPREDELYKTVETDFANGREPLEVVSEPAESLDALNTIALALGLGVRTNLRQALRDAWATHADFDSQEPDSTFASLDSWVGDDVDILIAGHTHLEKHIDECPHRPGGVYLNTGTWIRLIKLEPSFLEPAAIDDLIDGLTVRSMADLDAVKIADKPLVIRRRTVAYVEHHAESNTVRTGLRHVRDKAGLDDVCTCEGDPFEDRAGMKVTKLTTRSETDR
jgi:UDP-2,3-diacylglucosamine pyrophosphatase LpxH